MDTETGQVVEEGAAVHVVSSHDSPSSYQQTTTNINTILQYTNLSLLRLRDTGRMDTWRCAHNWLKMYCEQLAKNCSMVYYFSQTI